MIPVAVLKMGNFSGRPRKRGEVLTEERTIKFAPSMLAELQERSADSGMSMAEMVRRFVTTGLSATPGENIPLAGVVCAGDGCDITPFAPDGIAAQLALIEAEVAQIRAGVARIVDEANAEERAAA